MHEYVTALVEKLGDPPSVDDEDEPPPAESTEVCTYLCALRASVPAYVRMHMCDVLACVGTSSDVTAWPRASGLKH
jgi:hypothetical protein